MKLITAAIAKKFAKFPLGSQENLGTEAEVLVKYFNPSGIGTWYVTEAQLMPDGDYRLFGLVDLHEKGFSYFTLSELQALKCPPYGLGIERDLWFEDKKIKDVK